MSGGQAYCLGVTRSLSGRAWRYRLDDDRSGLALSQKLDLPEVIGRLLASRDVTAETAREWLNPTLRGFLPDPSTFVDMERAAERVARAIVDNETAAVFGDYDVDGATSAALLIRYFRACGRALRLYVPDRMREGYGPNVAALKTLAADGVKLVITVDCGTMAHAPLREGASAGMDVVVVDHHLATEVLPAAHAIVNPNRQDDLSGQGQLAAVGVAFMLAVAVNRTLRNCGWFAKAGVAEPDLKPLLDIVALGTVADVVPLTGLNRAFVTQGLRVGSQRQNVGLAALADVAGIPGAFSTYHMGFVFGPRVNAGGRVGRSDLGARLLSTTDIMEAAGIARELDKLNKERQAIEGMVLEAALADAERRGPRNGLVAAIGQDWHAGVIGIVASRLKDKYRRPSAVFAIDGAVAKASLRSISGVDLGRAVTQAVDAGLLINGGGHKMAAGLTVATERLDELVDRLDRALAPEVAASVEGASLRIDGALAAAAVDEGLYALIERAGPFGSGNPEPIFALPGMRIVHAAVVGQNHVSCTGMDESGTRLRGIAFRALDTDLGQALLKKGNRLHLAGKLKANEWRGERKIELTIEDAAVVA